MNNAESHYQTLFDQQSSTDALSVVRTEAMQTFRASGLPSSKTEAWKYLRLSALREQAFDLMPAGSVTRAAISAWLWADCYHVVCVNGFFDANLSDLPEQAGFHCETLGAALANADIQALLAQSDLRQSLVALNTALFQDGLVLRFAADCQLDKPIQCLFVTDDQGAGKTSQQRHVVLLEKGADVRLLTQHVSLTEHAFFTNAIWHIELAEHAKLQHQQVFSNNAKAIYFEHCLLNQATHSVYEGLSFLRGGHLVRTDLDQCFKGEYATCSVKGLSAANNDQQLDQHLRICHQVAHCRSEQFFKGIANDQARLILNGKVVVALNAQKSDAKQQYKNLLLSRQADIYTKPELEIYANDVKCAHGATVGQLSDEALFYLKSRGIVDAKSVLIAAFNQEVLDLIDLPDCKAWVSALFANG